MDACKTLTGVAHTLKVDFRRPVMSLKFLEQWLFAVALSLVFVTTAHQDQSAIYVGQGATLVGMHAIYVAPAQAPGHIQKQVFFVQHSTIITNSELLFFTDNVERTGTAVLQQDIRPIAFKRYVKATVSNAQVAQQYLSPSSGSNNGGIDLCLQILLLGVVNNSFNIISQSITTTRYNVNLFGYNTARSTCIFASFQNQRSPLEKHNRHFSLPPPAA